ncbi:ABC transporter ATP-binding protein [Falsiroseomonas sp. E2-1-a4]|uniref:ABC transporter ATP-binding protein n=1 Tax=Falsiroseomonas sp. E2-1-a4 TaxID=3239299 RepID=UPI003F2C6E01
MLRINGLTLGYGGPEPVLANLDLSLKEAQFASLVGPSGSGKTSVLRAITGLQRAQAGVIDLSVPPAEVGFLFQDDALLPWRTAAQNVALGLRIHGMSKADALARAEEWLARLGLAGFGGRFPRQLSGGQRKRVAIAQVLALRPRLLLMDEPFASLDAIVRTRVTQDLLNLVQREGISVLLVTHDLEESIALSDVVHVLSNGPRARILASRPVSIERPRDLVATRGHPAFAPLLRQLWRDLEGASSLPAEPLPEPVAA